MRLLLNKLPCGVISVAFWLLISAAPYRASAQSGSSPATVDSVKAAVSALFDAMRKSDSTAISGCFYPKAIIQSIDETLEPVLIRSHAINEFAHIISGLPPGVADEQAQFDAVRVDGNLASVWAPYRFLYKGVFHHCGVDALSLVRVSGVWKIQYILDTEHKTGCQ
jgi:hypothetical protein